MYLSFIIDSLDGMDDASYRSHLSPLVVVDFINLSASRGLFDRFIKYLVTYV